VSFFALTIRVHVIAILFPYTTLFRSDPRHPNHCAGLLLAHTLGARRSRLGDGRRLPGQPGVPERGPGEVRAERSDPHAGALLFRSEEHTSESSHVKISYAVFCLKKKS